MSVTASSYTLRGAVLTQLHDLSSCCKMVCSIWKRLTCAYTCDWRERVDWSWQASGRLEYRRIGSRWVSESLIYHPPLDLVLADGGQTQLPRASWSGRGRPPVFLPPCHVSILAGVTGPPSCYQLRSTGNALRYVVKISGLCARVQSILGFGAQPEDARSFVAVTVDQRSSDGVYSNEVLYY